MIISFMGMVALECSSVRELTKVESGRAGFCTDPTNYRFSVHSLGRSPELIWDFLGFWNGKKTNGRYTDRLLSSSWRRHRALRRV